MNKAEAEAALGWLECDRHLLASLEQLGKSIEQVRERVSFCQGCGCFTLGPWSGEMQSLAAALVEFVARLQSRGPKAGREVRHEARR